jgi:putative ABC transport system permease protein
MAMTDFTIIRRSLIARLFSTVTTVVTVAVAVAMMLVLLSMRDAGQQAFERGSGNMQLLVSGDASPLVAVLNGVFYANPPARALTWEKYKQIVAQYGLDHENAFAVPTQQGDSYNGLPVLATTPEFFSRFRPQEDQPWQLASGAFFAREFEVVLGAGAARTTGLRVGDRIFLTHGIAKSRQLGTPGEMAPHIHTDFAYTVVGILEPTGSSHDRAVFTDLNSTWIIHAHDRREREDPAVTTTTKDDLLDADRKITGIYIRVITSPGSSVSAVLPQVADALRRDPDVTVAQPVQEIRKLFAIVSNINAVFVAMAGVVMVSSGIGIMLALYNSMEQRRRQIAILRVLGCSRARIFGLIVTESAVLGLLGAGAGILLGMAGAQLVAAAMKQRLGVVVAPSVPLEWVLVVTLATVALASLAGIVPAVMAYRTSVAKNLKPIG